MRSCSSWGKEVGEKGFSCRGCGQRLLVETSREPVPEPSRAAAHSERENALMKRLRRGERVIWRGKPVKLAFLFSGSASIGWLLIIPSLFIVWWSVIAFVGLPSFFTLSSALITTLLAISVPSWQIMRYRNTEYMITNQRVITQTGAIGLDTRFVDLDKVQEVYVQVGLIDKRFRTGSVFVVTAGFSGFVPVAPTRQGILVRPSFEALREPYEVQRILQEAMEKTKASNRSIDRFWE